MHGAFELGEPAGRLGTMLPALSFFLPGVDGNYSCAIYNTTSVLAQWAAPADLVCLAPFFARDNALMMRLSLVVNAN